MTRRRSGFTLVELLMAMAVMVTIGGAVVALLAAGQSIARSQPEVADQQQRARVAVQAIASDLARAGAGVDRGAQAGPLARYFPAVEAAPDGGITIWYVPGRSAQTTLAFALATGELSAAVDDPSGFSAGSTALVFDASGCHDVLRVDDVIATVLVLRNLARRCAYAAGAIVAEGQVRTYRVDPVGRQLLRRDESTGSTVPVLDNVSAMTVEYLDAGRRLRFGVQLTTIAPRAEVRDLLVTFDVTVPNLWLS